MDGMLFVWIGRARKLALVNALGSTNTGAPMTEENRQLVTNDRLSKRNNQLKFKTVGKLLIILEIIYRTYIPQFNTGKPKDVDM